MKDNAAVAIIFKDGKFLTLKRSRKSKSFKGFWNFPGGGIEIDEEPIDAAVREAKEEADIVLDKNNLELVYKLEIEKINIYYFFTNKYDGIIKINDESEEFKWFAIKEFNSILFIPLPNQVLEFMNKVTNG